MLKSLKPWQMGTHLRVLIESYLMSTKRQGFDGFQNFLHFSTMDESSLSMKRVNMRKPAGYFELILRSEN